MTTIRTMVDSAVATSPAATEPAAIAPPTTATWQIDTAHSTAELAVRHMMVTTVKGHISVVEGSITLVERDLTQSSVAVVLDASSIDTRDDKRDDHLRSPDFLDVARFPSITFASTRIERGPDGYRIIGDLTLHGITRKAVLGAAFEGRQMDPWGNERAGFTADGVIDRRDFGLNWNQRLPTSGVLIGNDIRVSIEVEAILQG